MGARRPQKPAPAPHSAADAKLIDALYGLEPLFEPGRDRAAAGADGTRFESIQCPYCGESFEVLTDLSAGSARYIEDCQICCRPIELVLELDDVGALRALRAQRSD